MIVNDNVIHIETKVKSPIDKVWKCWNEPEHITKWYFATEDWHTPTAMNNLMLGGDFNYRMEAKDGSFGFDFKGIYDEIRYPDFISFHLEDDRKVKVVFKEEDNSTIIIEKFEPEDTNSVELQRDGWQAILNNFKKYVESI